MKHHVRISSLASLRGRAARGELGGAFDARADPHVRCATTEIPGHCAVDLSVVRMRVAFEKRGCSHQLARLTIPALRHIELAPGLLQRMLSRGIETFDRRDFGASHVRHWRLTPASRRAVDVDRARTAVAD